MPRKSSPRLPRFALGALVIGLACIVIVSVVRFGHPPASQASGPSKSIPIPLSGRLTRMAVTDGQWVERGQLLAELDTTAERSELAKTEAELKELLSTTQSAIRPMSFFPGLTGVLSSAVPVAETVTVPVKTPVAIKIPPASGKKSTVDTKANVSRADLAEKARADANAAVDKAAERVKMSTKALSEAQQVRDLLRPKEVAAQTAMKDAEKKQADSDDLLAAGAISRNEAQKYRDDLEAAKKALQEIQQAIAQADQAIDDARLESLAANEALGAKVNELNNASIAVTAAAAARDDFETAPARIENRSTPPPARTETKVVMRRAPLAVRQEAPPPIPLKVMVDEKAIGGSQQRIAELKKRIAELKAKIAAARIFAPASGHIRFGSDGSLSILL